MSDVSFYFTIAAILFSAIAIKEHRAKAWIISAEFVLASLASYLLIDQELYKIVGAHHVFSVRAAILFAAMFATLKIKGHWMAYIVMLLGGAYNVLQYFDYLLDWRSWIDDYYTPAAMAVMVLQLLYLIGIGHVGSWAGRFYRIARNWLCSYRVVSLRRRNARRIQQ